jgi:hypothetical protein
LRIKEQETHLTLHEHDDDDDDDDELRHVCPHGTIGLPLNCFFYEILIFEYFCENLSGKLKFKI